MNKKIKIAFIKVNGLATNGTEKFLQIISANLAKDRFEVDYYYCDSPSFKDSSVKLTMTTDSNRVNYMTEHGVNLIKFHVEAIDLSTYTHDWINTDFWEKFDENRYDIIQTGRAGHPEYPFYKIKHTPIVDSLHLSGMVDNQYNISRVMHICKWNADLWVKKGGDKKRIELVSHPMDLKYNGGDMREQCELSNKFVFGFHQRKEDSIFSEIPLKAYKKIEFDNNFFILLGGSNKYRKQAKELGIKNIIFLEHTGDMQFIYRFLNTLDVYAHGRKDGEVNSTAMAEAMYFGLPIVSHLSEINNGHVECIGNAGKVVQTDDEYVTEMLKLQNEKVYYDYRREEAKKRFAEKYELYGQIDRIINIYKDVIKNPFPHKIRRFFYHVINYIIKRLIVNKFTYLSLRKMQQIINR